VPRVTNLIGNVLIFFVLLFSPIIVPISQFPDWLAAIHRVLPFHYMAVVIRDGLTTGLVTDVAQAYLVLSAWTLGSWLLAARAIGRRG
jgi:ABC-2 type transport system permease protein